MAQITRICLTGPESTGKSELAARLAEHYRCDAVLEYAREYALARNNELSYEDVEPIARGEIALMDRASGSLVILDTDLVSTVVYSRFYYQDKCPSWVVEEARRRAADLYLLMNIDVPWKEDPARDTGQEREELFNRFRRTLDAFELPWMIISGNREKRFQAAVAEIDLVR